MVGNKYLRFQIITRNFGHLVHIPAGERIIRVPISILYYHIYHSRGIWYTWAIMLCRCESVVNVLYIIISFIIRRVFGDNIVYNKRRRV